MIRSLFKIGLLVVFVVLGYNYFFGDRAEKEQSRKIFGDMRNVVVSVGQLVKSEKAKFDAGKYDKALDKLGDAYRAVRGQAEYLDKNVLDRLDELEGRKAALEKELEELDRYDDPTPASTGKPGLKNKAQPDGTLSSAKKAEIQRRQEEIKRELNDLIRDSDELLQDAQK